MHEESGLVTAVEAAAEFGADQDSPRSCGTLGEPTGILEPHGKLRGDEVAEVAST